MNNKTLILLSNNKFNDPILNSQLVNIYRDKKFNFKEKILFCGVNTNDIQNENDFVLIDNYLGEKGIKRYIKYFNVLKKIIREKENSIIHIRGFVSVVVFYFIKILYKKKYSYIYDPRGIFLQELKERNKFYTILIPILSIIETNIIQNSKFTIATSNSFIDFYKTKYGFKDKYLLCYNVSSFKPQKPVKFNLSKDSINICYIGAINHWHPENEIIRLFEYLQELFKNDLKKIPNFYIYTSKSSHDKLKNEFANSKIQNYQIEFIQYKEVEKELRKMDICLSIVLPTTSTKGTSVIKIADYVLLGKLFILNKGVGDFDSFYEENNSALLYNFGESLKFDLKNLTEIKTNKNEQLINNFTIDTNISKIYDKINLEC